MIAVVLCCVAPLQHRRYLKMSYYNNNSGAGTISNIRYVQFTPKTLIHKYPFSGNKLRFGRVLTLEKQFQCVRNPSTANNIGHLTNF